MGSDPFQDLHHLNGYVRRATMADAGALQRYFERLDASTRAARFDGATDAARAMTKWISPDHSGFVALLKSTKQIIGELHAFSDRLGYEQLRFTADPGFSPAGVLATLLLRAIDEARRRGARHVSVRGLSPEDETATHIVKNHGFTPVVDSKRLEFRRDLRVLVIADFRPGLRANPPMRSASKDADGVLFKLKHRGRFTPVLRGTVPGEGFAHFVWIGDPVTLELARDKEVVRPAPGVVVVSHDDLVVRQASEMGVRSALAIRRRPLAAPITRDELQRRTAAARTSAVVMAADPRVPDMMAGLDLDLLVHDRFAGNGQVPNWVLESGLALGVMTKRPDRIRALQRERTS